MQTDFDIHIIRQHWIRDDEQYDSPMVDDRVNYRTTLGINYDF